MATIPNSPSGQLLLLITYKRPKAISSKSGMGPSSTVPLESVTTALLAAWANSAVVVVLCRSRSESPGVILARFAACMVGKFRQHETLRITHRILNTLQFFLVLLFSR